MITDSEKEKIRKEAQDILDGFGKALERVKEPVIIEEKAESYREEGEGRSPNPDFRKRVFGNAPRKKGDHFLAEKGDW